MDKGGLDGGVSAAWRFDARDRSGETVGISGALRDLAFSRKPSPVCPCLRVAKPSIISAACP